MREISRFSKKKCLPHSKGYRLTPWSKKETRAAENRGMSRLIALCHICGPSRLRSMKLNRLSELKIPSQLETFEIEILNVKLKPLVMKENNLILEMSPQIETFWHFQTTSFQRKK